MTTAKERIAKRTRTRIITITRGRQTKYQAEWEEVKEVGWPWARRVQRKWKPFVSYDIVDDVEVPASWTSKTSVQVFLDRWHIDNRSCCDIEYEEYPEGVVN